MKSVSFSLSRGTCAKLFIASVLWEYYSIQLGQICKRVGSYTAFNILILPAFHASKDRSTLKWCN